MAKRLFWEDYRIGTIYRSKAHHLRQAEILAFAEQFDPQPFHLDPVAARQSLYGGLIASGWHLASLSFRLFVDTGVFGDGQVSQGSPGVEQLQWRRPARPGDRLTLTAKILDKFSHKSKPEIGFLKFQFELNNQDDDLVLRLSSNLMLRRRAETPSRNGEPQ